MLGKVKKWIWDNRVDITIAIFLFVVAAVPRMWDLGTFLTADEKNWMGRSYEFIRAVKDWRFNDTLQTTHPGVITLWLSGAVITAKMFLSHTPFSYQNLAHFAAAAQFPIALVNSLAVPVIYLFLRRLFKPSYSPLSGGNSSLDKGRLGGVFLPLLSSFFIALNPLLIGYSRVAHVDALLASLMFLAALATLIYAQSGYKRGWLVTAAVLSGLAILTKAPAVFLLPFFVLVFLVHEPKFWLKRESLISRARDLTLWFIIVALMFVIIWPAMLFVPDPKGNVLLLKRDLGGAALTPHHMVEDYTLNTFHYPLALLTRTTPITLVFAVLAVVWLLIKKRRDKNLWLLVAYTFFFVVMMTLVAKKGDRYILPVFPVLDVLAAFGLVTVIGVLARGRKVAVAFAGVLAVLYLGAVTFRYHPYAIAYNNPLFRDNLSQELGWGEGLEQVAKWLNENEPDAIVASWYPEELGAYTSAQVAHINAHEQSKVRYVVLYRNMFGRAPDHYANNFIDEYYKKREPVFVAQVVGKEFAWVYEKRVFERVVGELLPGVKVEQEVFVVADNLKGVDVMLATYSGRAKAGALVVRLLELSPGSILDLVHEWRVPVTKIEDDRWLSLRLPNGKTVRQGGVVVMEISAVDTKPGSAPTVRYTTEHQYLLHNIIVNGEPRKGEAAVRLRYQSGDQEVTGEDTRLLK